jgi:hypothetical protein
VISKHCTGFVFMFSSFFTFTELVSPDFPFIYGQTDTFIHAQSFVCIVHLSFNASSLIHALVLFSESWLSCPCGQHAPEHPVHTFSTHKHQMSWSKPLNKDIFSKQTHPFPFVDNRTDIESDGQFHMN